MTLVADAMPVDNGSTTGEPEGPYRYQKFRTRKDPAWYRTHCDVSTVNGRRLSFVKWYAQDTSDGHSDDIGINDLGVSHDDMMLLSKNEFII